jgi:hypothetical protein
MSLLGECRFVARSGEELTSFQWARKIYNWPRHSSARMPVIY